MGAQFLQLVPDIFFNILKGVKKRGSNSGRPGAMLDSVAQVLLAGVHQSAIGVIDNHDFLSAKQIVRYDQRPQTIFRNDAAGVADDVRVSGSQPQRANREPRIHTRQHRQAPLWPRG